MAIMEGMILIAIALLTGNPKPAEKELIGAMDYNLSRICSYHNIIQVIVSVINAS